MTWSCICSTTVPPSSSATWPQKVGAIGCPINYNFAPGEIAIVWRTANRRCSSTTPNSPPKVERALELSAWKPAVRLRRRPLRGLRQDQPDSEPEAPGATSTTRCSGCTPPAPPVGPRRAGEQHQRGAHRSRRDDALPLNSTDRTMNMTPWFHRAASTQADPPHPVRRGRGHHPAGIQPQDLPQVRPAVPHHLPSSACPRFWPCWPGSRSGTR